MNIFFYNTSIGEIGIQEKDGFITNIYFVKPTEYVDVNIRESEIIKSAYVQIDEYLNKQRKSFHLPLLPQGTDFMKKCWKALMDIPYGKTMSYKEIAIKADSPKAYRAVGMAMNRNPIPIIIPCHRVIGSDGNLVGYGGGIEIKQKLLKLENFYNND